MKKEEKQYMYIVTSGKEVRTFQEVNDLAAFYAIVEEHTKTITRETIRNLLQTTKSKKKACKKAAKLINQENKKGISFVHILKLDTETGAVKNLIQV